MLISNSSTLILLAKVSLLSTFLDIVKQIAIPEIAFSEITVSQSFDSALIRKEAEQKRILIKKVSREEYTSALQHFKLDDGEASAYALFKKERGTALLTDDRELIKLCKLEKITFVCAMAIPVRLYKIKKLNKQEAMEKIDKLYSYGRYSKEIYNFFKSEVE